MSADESRTLLETIKRMRDALDDIRAHHVALNRSRGRPVENSHTIALCDRGLNGNEEGD